MSKAIMISDEALEIIMGIGGDDAFIMKILNQLGKENNNEGAATCVPGMMSLLAVLIVEVLDNVKSDIQGFASVIDSAYKLTTNEEKLKMLENMQALWGQLGKISTILLMGKYQND